MSNKGVSRSLSDIHDTLCALEDGSSLTRYFRNKRPESRMFRVLLETRELVWTRNVGGKPEGVGMFMLLNKMVKVKMNSATPDCFKSD